MQEQVQSRRHYVIEEEGCPSGKSRCFARFWLLMEGKQTNKNIQWKTKNLIAINSWGRQTANGASTGDGNM